ncbi:hypothetical protein KIW84_UN0127 [Lathyrus oleraceus]|nr:hypothetical protein KIW84_UN0127 [Pisum sativum]
MCKCRSHGTFPLFGLQSSHLNICYYHQDLHRRPLRPGSRPGFCSDRRALLLIRAWPLPQRPGGRVSAQLGTVTQLPVHPHRQFCLPKMAHLELSIPWHGSTEQPHRPTYLKFENRRTICTSVSLRASTRVSSGFAPLRHSSPSFGSRQVCSHSNPSQKIRVGRRCNPQEDPTNQLPCALRVYSPVDSHTCQTPWSVFQDGSNGEPTGRRQEHASAEARRISARCRPQS